MKMRNGRIRKENGSYIFHILLCSVQDMPHKHFFIEEKLGIQLQSRRHEIFHTVVTYSRNIS